MSRGFGRKTLPVCPTPGGRVTFFAGKLHELVKIAGEIVKRALSNHHSSISWMLTTDIRVVEILRFTSTLEWKYAKTTDMPEDLGTRRGVTVKDVSMESVWQIGFEWMKNEATSVPIKCFEEIMQYCNIESDKSNKSIKFKKIKK